MEAEKAEVTARNADRAVKRLEKSVADLKAQVAAGGNDELKKRLSDEIAELAAAEERAKQATDYAQEVGRGLEKWGTPFRYLGVEV